MSAGSNGFIRSNDYFKENTMFKKVIAIAQSVFEAVCLSDQRAREAYLARAQSHQELEQLQREWENGARSRFGLSRGY